MTDLQKSYLAQKCTCVLYSSMAGGLAIQPVPSC